MSENFSELLKTDDEVKTDIIEDFANDFFNELQKLIEKYGKEDLMKMLDYKRESA